MNQHDRSWNDRRDDIPRPVRATSPAPSLRDDEIFPYAVECADGTLDLYGRGAPRFKILVNTQSHLERLFALDAYSLATAFVRGEFTIEGDLVAAVRFYRTRHRSWISGVIPVLLANLGIGRFESLFQTKRQAAQNIRFHYDCSTNFYKQFLDSRMVYSCAYFDEEKDSSLEGAQLRKLEHICRKLNLQTGDRFLDIGCGWGGLILHATAQCGTISTGCTLSGEQFAFATQLVKERGLEKFVSVDLRDYRDIDGPFDKIASVGMFEHVGRRRLNQYFSQLSNLLRPGGLVLNHGIARPEGARDGPETLFMRRRVFPGGELPLLSDVIRSAENCGFEVLDVENLRPHYALTCRAWVARLQENAQQCLRYVDDSTYRTWLLAFAASAEFFEDGKLNLNQVLLYKPGNPAKRPFTREYIYRGTTKYPRRNYA